MFSLEGQEDNTRYPLHGSTSGTHARSIDSGTVRGPRLHSRLIKHRSNRFDGRGRFQWGRSTAQAILFETCIGGIMRQCGRPVAGRFFEKRGFFRSSTEQECAQRPEEDKFYVLKYAGYLQLSNLLIEYHFWLTSACHLT